jgi:hypothetical protein
MITDIIIFDDVFLNDAIRNDEMSYHYILPYDDAIIFWDDNMEW